MGLGYYGGRAIDTRVGGGGWITFVGFLFGVTVGFRSIFVAARYMQRDIERQERRDRGEDPWREKEEDDDGGKPQH